MCLLCCKGRSLRYLSGQGNPLSCVVVLYVGEGPRGSNGAGSTHCWIPVTRSATHNQIGPLWCWFPSGWACARPRPLWVSPTTSLVRLGVSPAAAPTPTGVFNQRFEALFPCAGALGCVVCFAPPLFLLVYLCVNVGPRGATRCFACTVLHHSESSPRFICANVGPQGLLVVRLPVPFVPYSTSLGAAMAT